MAAVEDCDVDDGDESDAGVDAVEEDQPDESTQAGTARPMAGDYQHHRERRDAAEQREGPGEHDEHADAAGGVADGRVRDAADREVLDHGEAEHRQRAHDAERRRHEQRRHQVDEEQARFRHPAGSLDV